MNHSQEIGSYSDSHRSRNSLFPVFLKRRGMKAAKTLTITSTYPLQRQYKLNIDREANIILFKCSSSKWTLKKNKYLFRNIEEGNRNSRWSHNIVFNHISEKLKMNYKKLA